MSEHHDCCYAAWAKYVLLAALIGGGAAGGLYFSGGWTGTNGPTVGSAVAVPQTLPDAGVSHRFPLSALDCKDQQEAPDLAADSSGRVFLTWASKTGDAERTVFVARSTDEGRTFDVPSAIAKGGIYRSVSRTNGKPVGYERRATPHIASVGDKVILAWSSAPVDGSALRMVMAVSTDAGSSFAQAQQVHHDAGATPTFTSLAVGPGGLVVCSWLGGGAQQPFTAVLPGGREEFEAEHLVYAGQDGRGVCPCCPTATAVAPDGTVYVAFRNIEDGYRDIAVCRQKPGQSSFEGPFPVIPPSWKFDGCPHDGPSMAIVEDTLHLVWMDARSGMQRCYYGRAKLADMKFASQELNPNAPGSQGNAKLFADAKGILHVVWEESFGVEPEANHEHHRGAPQLGSGGGRAIMYAQMHSCCKEFGQVRAIAPKNGAFQTRPSLIGTPRGDLYIAWNELDESGKAVVATRLNPKEQP